ncbi:SDR family oxidoreductase [Croceicoccus mobilis]|uniref:Fatty-acid-coa ligase FadD n=1 Tax=Croceicoccus mobilis TaxID=1703339 RepID=A0A916Z8N4_9SPHN|nr:SDR family oxidoreductase [Croceicoccus mobilis]GGD80814.1 putative fatty-acid-coa ligase FadD [Croceicoccus mobilis]
MTEEFNQSHLVEVARAKMRRMIANDPEIAARVPEPGVTAALQRPDASYRHMIAAVLEGYADRPALGSRHYELDDDGAGRMVRRYTDRFDTISYAELSRRIEAIASLWQHDAEHGAAAGEMIAFIAFTGAQMATIDLACNYAQTVSVPLQANLPGPDMREILTDIAPVVLAASIDNLDVATGYAIGQETIRSLIVMDSDDRVDAERSAIAQARKALADAGGMVKLITFDEAVARGAAIPWQPLPETGPDHVSMIMYTSGSTGKPKGAIIHDRISSQFWNETIPAYAPTVQVAYAPMNHFMGRNMVHSTLAQGGTAYFTLHSDMSTLFDDFRIARPTGILFIPRVCELVYQHFQSELQRRIARGEDEAMADAAVRAEMKDRHLGDRLCGGGVGSSPTAPEVRRFIAECFEMPFVEGYGQTEAGAAAITQGNRLTGYMGTEFKLVDVPELGYFTTDKPFPRGELYVKTDKLFQGYYKRPEATASVFSEDGYLKTGDIMEQRGPDHIVWVDRRGNVIKLSQAEFVAVGPLETTFLGNSSLIEQCFVYGSSYRSYLLAVVVPDIEVARAGLGHAPDDAELRELVLRELKEVARKAELKNFEIPRDVIIEREAFSYENGLLSSARKPLRPNRKRKYADRLEAKYEEMDRQQQAELARLREGGEGSVAEKVAGAFKANLGLATVDVESPRSFGDLGGDSLGAVGMSLLLEEMFGVSVPASAILHPAASVGWLAQLIERLLAGEGVTMGDVHPQSDILRADDLKLYKFIAEETLTGASQAAPPADEIRNVLVTGANGFLGRFLCLEWLEHAAGCDGTVYCLARGKTEKEARERLEAAFDKSDPDLLARFRELAENHLTVLCGDLADHRLGLGEDSFAMLAEKVDHIVHPAALVNHRLSYENLFAPNVKGAAELIALALTCRLKRFDYISTVGVPALLPSLTSAPEDTDVRNVPDPVPLSDAYANGYAASKWAGEVLLREAHDLFGLPVNVFRPNMIMPHRRYVGQYNETDMITRLLYSIVKTGLAPRSFYRLEPDGSRARAHYDGLPVFPGSDHRPPGARRRKIRSRFLPVQAVHSLRWRA